MNSTHLHYFGDVSKSRQLFRAEFDRAPFAFTHSLHASDCFGLEAIRKLATRVENKPGRWYVEKGDTTPQAGWRGGSSGVSAVQTLAEIEQNQSLVILKRMQQEPEYRPVFDQLRQELSEQLGFDLESRYRDGLMTVLVTSPGRVTPYHMDGEANLLMQMSGRKSVFIFDGNNRELLPDEELEGFWSGNIAAPRYKERLQDRAWEFVLGPGDGVSNPVAFPHWVQNGPEVSISISVNFKRAWDDTADAYKVNKRLRGLGLHPLQPGSMPMVDRLKGVAYRSAREAARCLKPIPAHQAGARLK